MDHSQVPALLAPAVYRPGLTARAFSDDSPMSQQLVLKPTVYHPKAPVRSATLPAQHQTNKDLPPPPGPQWRPLQVQVRPGEPSSASRPPTRKGPQRSSQAGGTFRPPVDSRSRPRTPSQIPPFAISPAMMSGRLSAPYPLDLTYDVAPVRKPSVTTLAYPQPAPHSATISRQNSDPSSISSGSSRPNARLLSSSSSTEPLRAPSREGTDDFAVPRSPPAPPPPLPPPPPAPSAPLSLSRNHPRTPYMDMLLSLDTIPRFHNILAAFFGWLVLVGFVTLPATFSTLGKADFVRSSTAATEILNSVTSVPLLVLAAVCVLTGVAGMAWLSIRWRRNYIWLLNRLYMPGILNALIGLLSTLTSVYGQQDGDWNISAKAAVGTEVAMLLLTGGLFVVYNNWLLGQVKRQHERQMGGSGEKTLLGRMARMATAPPIVPGSVV